MQRHVAQKKGASTRDFRITRKTPGGHTSCVTVLSLRLTQENFHARLINFQVKDNFRHLHFKESLERSVSLVKKFFVAAAASLLIFGSQAEAAPIDDLNVPAVELQEVGHWADFRDEVILGRESDRERRERKKWEQRERERYERERYERERYERERYERERERRDWEQRERERRDWERRNRRPLPPPPVYVPPAPRPGYGMPPPPAPVRPGLPPPPTRRR